MFDTSKEIFNLLSILIGFGCLIAGYTLYLMNKGVGEKNELTLGNKAKLAGGPGLMFAFLGVILILASITGQNPLTSLGTDEVTEQKQIPQGPPGPEVNAVPSSRTPDKIEASNILSTPNPTSVVQEGKITKNYLLGSWISIQPSGSETITFYDDNSFLAVDVLSSGETINVIGYFSIYGSELYLQYSDGLTASLPITYVDQDTFFMKMTYTRMR